MSHDRPTQARPFPDRVMRHGAHFVTETTRRAVTATGSRGQRLVMPTLLAPLLLIIFAFLAIALVVMVAVVTLLSAAIALTALAVRRRLSRTQ